MSRMLRVPTCAPHVHHARHVLSVPALAQAVARPAVARDVLRAAVPHPCSRTRVRSTGANARCHTRICARKVCMGSVTALTCVPYRPRASGHAKFSSDLHRPPTLQGRRARASHALLACHAAPLSRGHTPHGARGCPRGGSHVP
eukprot:355815-Alexandrium_andersonii.AAC.1